MSDEKRDEEVRWALQALLRAWEWGGQEACDALVERSRLYRKVQKAAEKVGLCDQGGLEVAEDEHTTEEARRLLETLTKEFHEANPGLYEQMLERAGLYQRCQAMAVKVGDHWRVGPVSLDGTVKKVMRTVKYDNRMDADDHANRFTQTRLAAIKYNLREAYPEGMWERIDQDKEQGNG